MAEDLNTPIVFQRYPRAVKAVTYGVTAASLLFLVFRADYGPREHCFSDVRRWAAAQAAAFWAPSAREQRGLEQIDAIIATQGAPASAAKPHE